jgi:hypothetical protein
MDNQLEILLNKYKNIHAINTDMYGKISLTNNVNEINEYDIRNVISATNVFDIERSEHEIYRIYGRIEYMSLLNGLKNNYTSFEDFFLPVYSGNSKNILNSFDFYLVRPTDSGNTHIITGSSTNNSTITYNRFFKVIATPDQFELFPIGFSNNVFGEQTYSYNFNVDINISEYLDEFGFPITELYLYAQYKNASIPVETLFAKQWSNTGVISTPQITTKALYNSELAQSLNNVKYGDIIDYSKLKFLQVQLYPEQFYITTPYNGGRLMWKYNPFIPLRLRYFTNSLYTANISGASYSQVQSIPYYATNIDGGNYVWRNIMLEGYFDPITGLGTNNPFVNDRRYSFASLLLDVMPDLGDEETLKAFSEVWYGRNAYKYSITPISNINNIGKPCQ